MWSQSPRDKLLAALFKSAPIEPQHKRPVSLTGGFGGGFFDSDQGDRFFTDFDMFPDKLNKLYTPEGGWDGGPWRLQELASTELSSARDAPDFGRRFNVFYNQANIGLVEIKPHHDYDAEKSPKVWTNIKLNCARLLPFSQVLGVLISLLDDNKDAETRRAIDLALLAAVWNTKNDDNDGTVELFVCCSFANYLRWKTVVINSRANGARAQ